MLYTFTFSHLADAFIQSDLQLGVHKAQQVAEEHLKFTTLHCMSYKWLLI